MMKKFEYKILGAVKWEDTQQTLNALGEEGWEAVGPWGNFSTLLNREKEAEFVHPLDMEINPQAPDEPQDHEPCRYCGR